MHLSLAAAFTALLAISSARPYQAVREVPTREVVHINTYTLSTHALPAPLNKRKATNFTPKGKKAGLSGYIGIEKKPAFKTLAPYISWYSDYAPNTPNAHGVKGVGMLWGATGSSCAQPTADRLAIFQQMMRNGKVPDYMFGFYEPDCYCPSSSEMTIAEGVKEWNQLLAPLKKKGTLLGSPSMCKQYDEDWLSPFQSQISTTWDVTAIHINKPNLAEAKKVVEYYVSKYKKPVWVAEFACVHDQGGWKPCTDQKEINRYIRDVVKYLEGNADVVAYGPSNGEGLGQVWPLTDGQGRLTASGRTYLDAVKRL